MLHIRTCILLTGVMLVSGLANCSINFEETDIQTTNIKYKDLHIIGRVILFEICTI